MGTGHMRGTPMPRCAVEKHTGGVLQLYLKDEALGREKYTAGPHPA